jgi:hypothetical protein
MKYRSKKRMEQKNFIDEMLSENSIDWTTIKLLVEDTGTYQGLGIGINGDNSCVFFDLEENIVLDSYLENSRVDERVHLIEVGL